MKACHLETLQFRKDVKSILQTLILNRDRSQTSNGEVGTRLLTTPPLPRLIRYWIKYPCRSKSFSLEVQNAYSWCEKVMSTFHICFLYAVGLSLFWIRLIEFEHLTFIVLFLFIVAVKTELYVSIYTYVYILRHPCSIVYYLTNSDFKSIYISIKTRTSDVFVALISV